MQTIEVKLTSLDGNYNFIYPIEKIETSLKLYSIYAENNKGLYERQYFFIFQKEDKELSYINFYTLEQFSSINRDMDVISTISEIRSSEKYLNNNFHIANLKELVEWSKLYNDNKIKININELSNIHSDFLPLSKVK
jgi:hypothetical protein